MLFLFRLDIPIMFRILINKIVAFGQRVLRMPRTRGFGVQSPTAYSILRNVLNERTFLKNYQHTHLTNSSYPIHASKQARLLFRLRSYYPLLSEATVPQLYDEAYLEQVLSCMTCQSVLFVRDIHTGGIDKGIWNRLLSDTRTILTFDLWDCGVVFFDNTKIKQNFKVNY